MSDKNKFDRGIELVVSAVISRDNGDILLTRSAKWNNKWTLPGGHVEVGESLKDALRREILEETGLLVEPKEVAAVGELVGSADFHRPAHFVYIDFACEALSDDIKLDGSELSEYVWVEPGQALTYDLAESFDETIEKYIEKQ